jgi:oligopeptide/dipeptide ABC transporter ATP-binding protein
VAVLYAGRIREIALAADFFRTPLHPYSEALVQWSATRLSGNMEVVDSSLGTEGAESILGCRFHIRCPKVQDDCLEREPRLEQIDRVRRVRCLYWKS